MLHGAGSTTNDAFYRAFVPELGSVLYPRQIELVKRCLKSERGELDRVGATIFPGLGKVSRSASAQEGENTYTVVRRAQVICECALGGSPLVDSAPDAQPVFGGEMTHEPAESAGPYPPPSFTGGTMHDPDSGPM